MEGQLRGEIAKEELIPRFSNVTRSYKQDGSFITEADLAVQTRIQALLQEYYPDISFLGEEMSVEQQQSVLEHPHGVWILDPLDGTRAQQERPPRSRGSCPWWSHR